MFGWLKRLFRKPEETPEERLARIRKWFNSSSVTIAEVKPEQVQHEDPVCREIIARAFSTGNMVFGNVNEDGTVEIVEIQPENSQEFASGANDGQDDANPAL